MGGGGEEEEEEGDSPGGREESLRGEERNGDEGTEGDLIMHSSGRKRRDGRRGETKGDTYAGGSRGTRSGEGKRRR